MEAAQALTTALITNLCHDLRCALDIDLHTGALQPLDNDAHPAQSRNEFECPNDTELKEVCVLSSQGPGASAVLSRCIAYMCLPCHPCEVSKECCPGKDDRVL